MQEEYSFLHLSRFQAKELLRYGLNEEKLTKFRQIRDQVEKRIKDWLAEQA